MEACGSAHHWGRLASRLGHRALLTSPQFVSPHVKSNKNDANDADGIAEAACRPTMRFVGVKDVDRQCVRQTHRARQLAVKARTAQCNQIHGFLLEYGIESSKGVGAVLRRLPEVLEDAENEVPFDARGLLRELGEELRRCARRRSATTGAAAGRWICRSGAARTWRRSRWPTRTLEPHGRCWPAGRTSTPATSARQPSNRRTAGGAFGHGRLPGGTGRERLRGVKLEVMARQVGPARQEPALDKGLRDRRLVEAGVRGTHQGPGAFASVERPNTCQQLTLSRQSPTTRSLQTRGGPYMSSER